MWWNIYRAYFAISWGKGKTACSMRNLWLYNIWVFANVSSATCEHLNAINTYAANYNDECFAVLQRARIKQHLNFLEAIYILFNRPSLCKQNPRHSLEMFLAWLRVVSFVFPLSFVEPTFFISPPFYLLSFTLMTLKRPPVESLNKSPNEKALLSSIIKYFLFIFFLFSSHLHLPVTTYDSFKYSTIQICMY